MRKLEALVILIILSMAIPALAQTDTPVPSVTPYPTGVAGQCVAGMRCGLVPWKMPVMPLLESPTPMPTLFYTALPTLEPPTHTPEGYGNSIPDCFDVFGSPTCTPTPEGWDITPSATSLFDTAGLDAQMQTIQAIMNSSPIAVEINGTPVTVSDQIATASPGIEDIFGRVKGILGADWGPFSPPVQAFLTGIGVGFFLVALTYTIPILGFVFGMVRKIYHAIMEFIPL